jgi:AcrR family transcriptional regulator
MIAKDAGIAEGTIYSYFDSKRDLLDEVLRRHYSLLFDDVEQTYVWTTHTLRAPSRRRTSIALPRSKPQNGGFDEE